MGYLTGEIVLTDQMVVSAFLASFIGLAVGIWVDNHDPKAPKGEETFDARKLCNACMKELGKELDQRRRLRSNMWAGFSLGFPIAWAAFYYLLGGWG